MQHGDENECFTISLDNDDDDEDVQELVDAAQIGFEVIQISDDESDSESSKKDENESEVTVNSFLKWKEGAGTQFRALCRGKSDITKKRKKRDTNALKKDKANAVFLFY